MEAKPDAYLYAICRWGYESKRRGGWKITPMLRLERTLGYIGSVWLVQGASATGFTRLLCHGDGTHAEQARKLARLGAVRLDRLTAQTIATAAQVLALIGRE